LGFIAEKGNEPPTPGTGGGEIVSMNRKANTKNPYQGKYKRVLCVCSAGVLRSPTAALVLSMEPFNFNTRACGINEDFALIKLDEFLLEWADEIICMDEHQEKHLKAVTTKPIFNLRISDNFEYRDKGLMEIIKKRYKEIALEEPSTQKGGAE
jgi:predicted protein tyrosine phosphatase